MNLRKDHYWVRVFKARPPTLCLLYHVALAGLSFGAAGGTTAPDPCLPGAFLKFCVKLCCLSLYQIIQNFQQRISWFWHRWRTQRNAISNANCRIQWVIESLNAHCALWYSEGHACSSVIIKPSSLACCWALCHLVIGPKDNDWCRTDSICNELITARI